MNRETKQDLRRMLVEGLTPKITHLSEASIGGRAKKVYKKAGYDATAFAQEIVDYLSSPIPQDYAEKLRTYKEKEEYFNKYVGYNPARRTPAGSRQEQEMIDYRVNVLKVAEKKLKADMMKQIVAIGAKYGITKMEETDLTYIEDFFSPKASVLKRTLSSLLEGLARYNRIGERLSESHTPTSGPLQENWQQGIPTALDHTTEVVNRMESVLTTTSEHAELYDDDYVLVEDALEKLRQMVEDLEDLSKKFRRAGWK